MAEVSSASMEVDSTTEGQIPTQVAVQPEAGPSNTTYDTEASSSKPPPKQPRHRPPPPTPAEIEASLLRRVTTIKEGDNVLLRLPSDAIKAVVASKDGLVQLGKFGAFPCRELLGLHYDITYEIFKNASDEVEDLSELVNTGPAVPFGQKAGKKAKKNTKSGKGGVQQSGQNGVRSNPGWLNHLRPLKKRAIVEAIIDDIQETNEFIEDDDSKLDILSHEEIADLRKQGVSVDEMIKRQMERHDKFALKTDFSKEKWLKRKEKKFSQTVHPIAPTVANITSHYLARAPYTTLHMREDTMSQLLNLSNVRPDGRYLVVDDTGGLVTAAILDRIGCQGRIMTFVDADSPPGWGVLSTMNFSQDELACVKWLSWHEAEEDYVKPAPPDEEKEGLPEIAAHKTQSRNRRHMGQVAELNATRDELHCGGWDGLIVASELNPMSVLARLTPYILGSGTITVYSPHQQVLAETLQWIRTNNNFIGQSLSESWTRTYQVLPGRTHPQMTTSATGGYLLHAIRVLPVDPPPQTGENRGTKRKSEGAGGGKSKKPATETTEGDETSVVPNLTDANEANDPAQDSVAEEAKMDLDSVSADVPAGVEAGTEAAPSKSA